MAANKTEEEKQELFDEILKEISIKGISLRKALKGKLSPETFYKFMKATQERTNHYARACDERADIIFEDMFDIADDGTNDYTETDIGDGIMVEKLNSENIQRSRLRIDTRKWALSKMNPKKYGDKLDLNNNHSGAVATTVLSKEAAETISDEFKENI